MDLKWPKHIVGYHERKLVEGKEDIRCALQPLQSAALEETAATFLGENKYFLEKKIPDETQNVYPHAGATLHKGMRPIERAAALGHW